MATSARDISPADFRFPLAPWAAGAFRVEQPLVVVQRELARRAAHGFRIPVDQWFEIDRVVLPGASVKVTLARPA